MAYSCASKEEATKKAQAFLKKVKGKGWKIRVHQNMGWFYCLQNGYLSVHEYDWDDDGLSYSCGLSNEVGGVGTPMYWSDHPTHYDDPNEAIAGQIKRARAFIDRCNNVVQHAEMVAEPCLKATELLKELRSIK